MLWELSERISPYKVFHTSWEGFEPCPIPRKSGIGDTEGHYSIEEKT